MKVILLSGGLDSATLLASEVVNGESPRCICFDYGQRHRREIESARCIAQHYGSPLAIQRLPVGLMFGSALTGGVDVPRGLHYENPGQLATVVPGRNAVLISIAVAHTVQVGATAVLVGAHKGDAAVYADCRPDFFSAMDSACAAAYGVRVMAPQIGMTKRGIATLAKSLNVPLELTWSCYCGGATPCGECGACIERAEACSE